ncbi:hypothetical protein GLOIN_2v1871466 [Rhizophagus clarus]|uniref:Uncharacterized protein n=1 Tax=Rhizophagus clarus TaxID=94130 RepID=A0A8H3L9J6_9GLOM|nr:hypothetical protein GLOIN_2v1871466 [Rhizophagus clarus]
MPVIGTSGSDKTNILGNLFLGTKAEYICKSKKGPKGTSYDSRYIACDDLIVCGYYPDELNYISPEKIPSVRAFSPERSTVIVFEDIHSHEDIFKIIRRYTDDVKNVSMVINSYLRKGEFVVFDLTRPKDDPLTIRLRFDTPLNLQKEIMVRQKHEEKSTSTNE